jgi:hypothetical protein
MELSPVIRKVGDDLQKLRGILGRASALARDHGLSSVMVGLAGSESDPEFPDVVDFVESELRMEDAVFRLTRDRVVLFVADVRRADAEEIMQRILLGYSERAARADDPRVRLRYFEVQPGSDPLTVKEVLPALFVPDAEA